MSNYFHFRSAVSAVVLLSASVALLSASHAKGAQPSMASQKTAITAVLAYELSRATPDHVKVSPFDITSLDVRSNWALAGVKSTRKRGLDPFSVLLHKVGGNWKFVTLGTNLMGAGKQYHVPRALWKRWQLGL